MRQTRTFLTLAATLLLTSACSSYVFTGPFTVERDMATAETLSAPEGSFAEHLRFKYLALSRIEYDESDYADAAWYAEQAIAAGQGQVPAPAVPDGANFQEPAAALAELQAARADLVAALDGGARDAFPDQASTAQTMYDCWVEEQEENHEFDEIAACKQGFLDAMAAMRAKPAAAPAKAPMAMAEPMARDFLVFFDFDKSNVRADAAAILAQVNKAISSLDVKKIQLIGHADTAGPGSYNQKLSERRAAAVKAWLAGKGVAKAGMSTSGKGETDPRVKTPDGVREQENRRVEIHLE